MTMAASLFLTGCGGSDYTTMSGNGSDNNSGDSNGSGKRVVNVCSWGEYIDEDLIYKFEDETGIKVNYQTAESNEALYSLLKTGAGDYDVIVPSDYMIARLIDEGMLAELNYDNIPNYEKIGEQYKSLSFDPENKYTVPYTWGYPGHHLQFHHGGRRHRQLGRHVRREVRRKRPDDPQLPGRAGRRPAGSGL